VGTVFSGEQYFVAVVQAYELHSTPRQNWKVGFLVFYY
jgi:hypothetical protein